MGLKAARPVHCIGFCTTRIGDMQELSMLLYESGAAWRVQYAIDTARTSQRARCAGDSYTRGASAQRPHKRPVAAGVPDEVHSGGDNGWCAPPGHAADTEQRSNARIALLWG